MSKVLRGFPARFPVRADGERSLRYHAVSASTRMLLSAWFRRHLRIEHLERVPMQGPLLVVCNHISNLDPFLFGGFMPGTMYCMAKRELFSLPPLAWLLAGCNCFPVDRGAPDRRALRTSLDIL